jgi:hypothetical protein
MTVYVYGIAREQRKQDHVRQGNPGESSIHVRLAHKCKTFGPPTIGVGAMISGPVPLVG